MRATPKRKTRDWCTGPDDTPPRGHRRGIVAADGGRHRARVRPLHRRRDGGAVGRRGPRPRRARDGEAARPRGDGRPRRHRPSGGGGPGCARGPVGEDAPERAVPPAARARRRDRRQPQGARGARDAQRGQGARLDEAGGRRRGRELPLHGLGRRVDRGLDAPDRRVDPRLHAEGARGRLRADRPVELPDHARRLEARTRARGRLHGCPQAGPGDAAHRDPPRRARRGGRESLPGS